MQGVRAAVTRRVSVHIAYSNIAIAIAVAVAVAVQSSDQFRVGR